MNRLQHTVMSCKCTADKIRNTRQGFRSIVLPPIQTAPTSRRLEGGFLSEYQFEGVSKEKWKKRREREGGLCPIMSK